MKKLVKAVAVLGLAAAMALPLAACGEAGKSAYDIAVEHGFVGTEEEWLESLRGPQGEKGEQGEQGSQGEKGEQGEAGTPGTTPSITINEDGYWVINGEVTDVKAEGEDGKDGQDGASGPQGPSGTPGTDGDRGSLWFYGSDVPSAHVFDSDEPLQEGDMYLCSANNSIWYYENAAWRVVTSFGGSNVGQADDQESLEEAIATAGENGMVSLAAGQYDLTGIALPAGFTLVGTGETKIDLPSGYTVSSDNVTFTGIQFTGDDEADYTIQVTGDDVTISNCTFTEGPANTYTGHVLVKDETSNVVIEDCNFSGSFRSVYVTAAESVTIRNCVLDAVYPINVGVENGENGVTLTVEDTTLNGWTSYNLGKGGKASFTDCTFGKETYYDTYAFFRPYSETVLTNCKFSEDMTMDTANAATSVKFSECEYAEEAFTVDSLYAMISGAGDLTNEDYANISATQWEIDGEVPSGFEVEAATQAELMTALALGASKVTLNADVTMTQALTFNKNITLDLGGYTFVYTNENSIVISDGASVMLTGAEGSAVDFGRDDDGSADISVSGTGSSLTIEGIEMNMVGGILTLGDGQTDTAPASLTVEDATLNSESYCISTNASTENGVQKWKNVSITVTDSELKASTPIMLNVEGTLTVDGCTIEGTTHGIFLRAGKAEISDSTISTTFTAEDEEGHPYHETWASGNCATAGAIVIGNKNGAGYYADAVCTLSGEINVSAPANSYGTYVIYVTGNSTTYSGINDDKAFTTSIDYTGVTGGTFLGDDITVEPNGENAEIFINGEEYSATAEEPAGTEGNPADEPEA